MTFKKGACRVRQIVHTQTIQDGSKTAYRHVDANARVLMDMIMELVMECILSKVIDSSTDTLDDKRTTPIKQSQQP